MKILLSTTLLLSALIATPAFSLDKLTVAYRCTLENSNERDFCLGVQKNFESNTVTAKYIRGGFGANEYCTLTDANGDRGIAYQGSPLHRYVDDDQFLFAWGNAKKVQIESRMGPMADLIKDDYVFFISSSYSSLTYLPKDFFDSEGTPQGKEIFSYYTLVDGKVNPINCEIELVEEY